MSRILAVAIALLVGGCSASPSVPAEPPITDFDGGSGPFVRVCATLRRLGCPEGAPPNGRSCAQVLTHAAGLAPVPTECLASASSVTEVRTCGSNSTIRVLCSP